MTSTPRRQALFEHMMDEHGITLLESEMDEIVGLVESDLRLELAAMQAQRDEAIDALRLAYSHIQSHHSVNKMCGLKLGAACPVCHHEDHTEPEMDKIVAVINKARDAR